MLTTMYGRAGKFLGVREIEGNEDHPLIQWWHSLCDLEGSLNTPDETAWCSAAMNGIAWDLDLPRSHSKAARSWLSVGTAVEIADAKPCENDLVIFWRVVPTGWQGHVGIFCGTDGVNVIVRGGNQGDRFCDSRYPVAQILGFRRLG